MSIDMEKLGKIKQSIVDDFIRTKVGFENQSVVVGPKFGVDVAIVDLPGDWSMAMTSDPLSLIPSLGMEASAWLSVHLMANDMATTGYSPQYGQFVFNLPPWLSSEDFKHYWNYIHKFCKDIGTAITGGHTGFIEGQNSTIAGGGTFTTIAPKGKMLTSQGAHVGDVIMVTKSAALSSASILAMSFPQTLINRVGQETQLQVAEKFFHTSSLSEAMAAVGNTDEERSQITAMHDVTEGGVLGAIYELASAANVGVNVYDELLPIDDEVAKVCQIFDLNPRFCIGAGSMVVTCKSSSQNEVLNRINQKGIKCSVVGEITEKTQGLQWMTTEGIRKMPYYEVDPYWNAFFEAFKKGWK